MGKNRLLKNITGFFAGAAILATPIFAFYKTNFNINTNLSKQSTNNVNLNEHGIALSSYLIEGWKGDTFKIQVKNNNQVLKTNKITWKIIGSDKFSITDSYDQDGNYIVSINEQYGKNENNEAKLQATYIDENGYAYTSTCILRVLCIYSLKPNVKDTVLLLNGNEATIELSSDSSVDFKDFDYTVSDNTYYLISGVPKIVDNKLTISVTSNSKGFTGRATFTFFHKNDQQLKEYATTVNIIVAENDLQLTLNDQKISDISVKTNDAITIKPLLNGSEAAKDSVRWTTSQPDVCTFKETDTGSVELIFHKASIEPIIISCYETLATENINFKQFYVNVSDSHLVINKPTKNTFKYLDGGFDLTAKMDGVDVSTNLTWASANTDIANVDANGHVVFVRTGDTTITAKWKNSNGTIYSDKFSFTIIENDMKVNYTDLKVNLGDVGVSLKITIDGKDVPYEKIAFVSENPSIVSIDNVGKLTYTGIGSTKLHAYYKDYIAVQGFETTTNVIVSEAQTKSFTLSWKTKTFGTNELNPNTILPIAKYDNIEIAYNDPNLVWTGPDGFSYNKETGYFDIPPKTGDFILICTYQTPTGLIVSDKVNIHLQEYFINNYDSQEPNITIDSIGFINEKLQLHFYFDEARTDEIVVQSCKSLNTKRVEVDNNGLMTFKGHGHADIICELIYEHQNGDKIIKTSTVHIYVKVPLWMWFATAGIFLTIIGLGIILPICLHNKNKKKKGKSGKSGSAVDNKTFIETLSKKQLQELLNANVSTETLSRKDMLAKLRKEVKRQETLNAKKNGQVTSKVKTIKKYKTSSVKPSKIDNSGKTPYYDVLTDKELIKQLRKEVKKEESSNKYKK